jgi:hypothetical protein
MQVGTNLLYEFVSLHVRLCSNIKREGQVMILNIKMITSVDDEY